MIWKNSTNILLQFIRKINVTFTLFVNIISINYFKNNIPLIFHRHDDDYRIILEGGRSDIKHTVLYVQNLNNFIDRHQ